MRRYGCSSRLVAAKPDEFSADNAKGIEGEALFLRAYFTSKRIGCGEIFLTTRETDTDFRKANGTAADAITNILKDLDAAIALLPATPRNGNVGRATPWTAKAYKGRVQMYAGQYAAALTQLREVRQEQRRIRAGVELRQGVDGLQTRERKGDHLRLSGFGE